MYNYLNKLNKWCVVGLLTLVSSQFAYAEGLEGRWQHNGQPTLVRSGHHHRMLFCNEQGDCAEGSYRGQNLIFVPRWNVTGVVSRTQDVISWSNRTQWVRNDMPPRNEIRVEIGNHGSIDGPWIHEGKPASIRMDRDRIHFTIINELGQPFQGFINENRQLVLPGLHVIGQLRHHGKMIEWSNGTTWHRP